MGTLPLHKHVYTDPDDGSETLKKLLTRTRGKIPKGSQSGQGYHCRATPTAVLRGQIQTEDSLPGSGDV